MLCDEPLIATVRLQIDKIIVQRDEAGISRGYGFVEVNWEGWGRVW